MKLRSLAQRGTAGETAPAAQRIPRLGRTAAPLSFAQQRLWFLEQLEPASPRFNIMTAVRLRGELRADLVGWSINQIVQRHEILRTVFHQRDGVPQQVVLPALAVAVPLVDLSALHGDGAARQLTAILAGDAAGSFDLARGPLVRVRLLRCAADDHVLALGLHQVVVDRWSRGLFVHEIGALYAAALAGLPPALPELHIQYSDFALWQREQLAGEATAALASYWRRQLAPPLPGLDLPTDRVRPALQSWRGAMEYAVIPQPRLERLQEVARRRGATLFTVLLTLWNVLLHRLSGQQDLVVGSPVANRRHRDVENLMGFFVNMLPLRLVLDCRATLGELLAQAGEVALGALEHQDLPFEKLVDDLHLDRDLSHHPLFQTTLTLQSSSIPPLQIRGLAMSLMPVDWGTTAYDLAIFCWQTELWENLEPGLSITLVYCRELFDRVSIRRLVDRFTHLAAEAADGMDTPAASLMPLAEAEAHQVLVAGNDTAAPPPEQETLAALFAAGARRAGAAPAVSQGERTLTYEQLHARVNRLARHLIRLGLPPEGVVGLHLERSIEFVVAVLAVVAAGGAYLPLDPLDPPARLAALVAQAQPVLVIDAPAMGGLVALHPRQYAFDRLLADAASRDDPPPVGAGGGADTLACVLFTSGSTGTPKGVMVPQGGVIRLATANPGGIGAGSRVAHAAAPGFDAATFEIWNTLLRGGELVVVSRDDLLDFHSRPRRFTASGIDTWFLPTASFHQIAAAAPAAFATLGTLLVGGEALATPPVRQVMLAGPPRNFYNLYGPAECTTFATRGRISAAPGAGAVVPIGRPIAETAAYVLDGDLQPVPLGAVGEICLAGAGLARGYLGDPSLTAWRFRPLPGSLGGAPGARLYRTGDLGSMRADGQLVWRGRRDRQLKVRGFRVELAEIEEMAAAHPQVAAAAATTHTLGTGELVIALHVCARAGGGPEVRDLLRFLRERLPGYMVPASVQVLDELPRTRHGKVDRAALARCARSTGERSAPAARLPTAMEARVAEVWREVLGREVGIGEDFFIAGGHSLHLTQIAARLERTLGVEVAVRSLFELRTIAAQAAALVV